MIKTVHSLNLRFPEWTLGSQPPISSDCTLRTHGQTDAGGVPIDLMCFKHCFWYPSRYLLRYCLQEKLCSSKNFSSGILLGLSTITNVYTQNHPSAIGAWQSSGSVLSPCCQMWTSREHEGGISSIPFASLHPNTVTSAVAAQRMSPSLAP